MSTFKQSTIAFAIITALSSTAYAVESNPTINKAEKAPTSVSEKKSETIVTKENFINADTVRAYLKELSQTGAEINKVRTVRDRCDTDNQDVIRMNDDTLYSRVILDVKGGATITTQPYEGYQNINVLDENHVQIAALTGPGTVKVSEKDLSTGQHVYVIIRTGLLRDMKDKEAMKNKAFAAQDKITVTTNSSDPFVPKTTYSQESLDKMKFKILKDFALHPQKDLIKRGFGSLKERDIEAARVVVAIGWGGMSSESAVYSSATGKGDRNEITIDTPNLGYKDKKGFFSFTVYNGDGYIATQKYAINSDEMIPNPDGTYTITFLASGEPTLESDKNIIRTPRGKFYTIAIRAYAPKDAEESFKWVDKWAAKMTEKFMK